jgi:hypothetical protein
VWCRFGGLRRVARWVWEVMVVSNEGNSVVRLSCSVRELKAVVRTRSWLASRLISS